VATCSVPRPERRREDDADARHPHRGCLRSGDGRRYPPQAGKWRGDPPTDLDHARVARPATKRVGFATGELVALLSAARLRPWWMTSSSCLNKDILCLDLGRGGPHVGEPRGQRFGAGQPARRCLSWPADWWSFTLGDRRDRDAHCRRRLKGLVAPNGTSRCGACFINVAVVPWNFQGTTANATSSGFLAVGSDEAVPLLCVVGPAFTSSYQAPQTAVNIGAPCV
jgi:hypothetical protein